MYRFIIIIPLIFSINVVANKTILCEELTATLEKILIQHITPAMAVAVITSGKTTYIKAFGFLDETKV